MPSNRKGFQSNHLSVGQRNGPTTVNRIYQTLRDRERNFRRGTYANHGIEEPKLDRNVKTRLQKEYPYLQIITRAQWERQWRVTESRLQTRLDLRRPVVWWLQTKSGGASSQSVGHLPRSQAWMFGKLAQTFPKPTSIMLDTRTGFPIRDGTQIVVSDDASYGGTQLSAGFQKLIQYLNRRENCEQMMDHRPAFTVYLAVPFLHIHAWNTIQSEIRSAMKYQPKLRETSRSIHTSNRFFDLHVHFLGRTMHETRNQPVIPGSSIREPYPTFILEHKVADESSLGAISKEIRKIYDPKPIYKRDTVSYVPKLLERNRNREFFIGRPTRNNGTRTSRPFTIL